MSLTLDQKNKIEEELIKIFKDVCFNNENILAAKDESDHVSEEIRQFILSYAASNENISEVELFIKAKEKGLELVKDHDLIFFDEIIEGALKMRAFLIPGMKVEITDENATEEVTEDDLQAVDHELCVSFKTNGNNEFVKLGNLIDIRARLAKPLGKKTVKDIEVNKVIKQNKIFKQCLELVLESASKLLSSQ